MKYGFRKKMIPLRRSMDLQKKKWWAFIIRRDILTKYGFEKKDGFEMKYGFAEKKMMGICIVDERISWSMDLKKNNGSDTSMDLQKKNGYS